MAVESKSVDRRGDPDRPLEDLDHWEEFLKARYPEPPALVIRITRRPGGRVRLPATTARKRARASRSSTASTTPTRPTTSLARKRREFLSLDKRRMGIWEAMEYLNTLVDDSDPDTDLSQIEHLLQSAESARRDGQPAGSS